MLFSILALAGPILARAKGWNLCLVEEWGHRDSPPVFAPVDISIDRHGQAWLLTAGDCKLRPLLSDGTFGESITAGCGEGIGQFYGASALSGNGVEFLIHAKSGIERYHGTLGYLGEAELDGPLPADPMVATGHILARAASQPELLLRLDQGGIRSRILWTAQPHGWLQPLHEDRGEILVLDHQRAILHRLDALGQSQEQWELGEHRGRLKEQGVVSIGNPAVSASSWIPGRGLLVALAMDINGENPRRLRLYREGFRDYDWVEVKEGIVGGRLHRSEDARLWIINKQGHRVQRVALHGRNEVCPGS